jgi:peptidoglycan hydrolase-like protein with peptidoglycan-binding domain
MKEEGSMTKDGLILPLCFLLVSGCALSEAPEMPPQQSVVASAVTERQSMPSPVANAPGNELSEQTLVSKTYTPEELRRLQVDLKELGFDPGPADGIVGNKTKIALQRLHAGCAQVNALVESPSNREGSTSEKTYTRAETLKMQAELRRAGFYIGSADGVFGSRTRAVVTHLRRLCPAMPEYASLLASPVDDVKPRTVEPNRAHTAAASATAPLRVEAVRMVGAPPPARTQEEIRVLQLRLRDAGFDPGAFDGVMGPKTEKALQDHQAAHRAGKIKASLTTEISSFY